MNPTFLLKTDLLVQIDRLPSIITRPNELHLTPNKNKKNQTNCRLISVEDVQFDDRSFDRTVETGTRTLQFINRQGGSLKS